MKEDKLIQLKLPPGVYRQKPLDKVHRQMREKQVGFIPTIVKYPKSGGVFVHHLGRIFPEKGLPSPDTINDLNIVKKLFLTHIDSYAGKHSLFVNIGVLVSPWKWKISRAERILTDITYFSKIQISHHYLQKRFYSSIAKELRTLVYTFLQALGFSKFVCSGISDVAMNFIQYDNAYYFRVGDFFSETTKEKLLANPGKEIDRLLTIHFSRGGDRIKIGAIGTMLRFFLLHPKIKKAFRQAVTYTDIEKLKMDEADRYYCLLPKDYNYMGASWEVRVETYAQLHLRRGDTQLPPMIEIQTA